MSKRDVKPTYMQKKRIAAEGLDWKDYLVRYEDNILLTIVNKRTGIVEEIFKFTPVKEKGGVCL